MCEALDTHCLVTSLSLSTYVNVKRFYSSFLSCMFQKLYFCKRNLASVCSWPHTSPVLDLLSIEYSSTESCLLLWSVTLTHLCSSGQLSFFLSWIHSTGLQRETDARSTQGVHRSILLACSHWTESCLAAGNVCGLFRCFTW